MLAVRTATRCHSNYTAWYFKCADKTTLCAEFCCFTAAMAYVSGSFSNCKEYRDWVAGAALGSAVRVCALFDDAVNCYGYTPSVQKEE